ncbi:iron-sulfur cluster repair di-iron protein [Bacillus marasmi]|uniref:iron-sulfur cluster repair di-iron protein n=1 Tax=Bacillus marasmi TaxID=1926279 RepID=UPI0011C6F9B8|nr:iron-sulfur cluster repair di-iron protein [Bacillus marasmi]
MTTTMPFSDTSLVRDIVNEIPKSADLFKSYRIDFCCGGNRPVKEAAAERNVNVDKLMEDLAQVYEKSAGEPVDMEVWTNTDSETLINHIIEKYHRPLEEELTMLSPYVTKVAKVHGDSHPEFLRVHDLFFALKKELLEHTAKEEATIFPTLLTLDQLEGEEREKTVAELKKLEEEHDAAGAILFELRDITSDYVPPIDACGTYRLVYKRLEMLEAETFMHVHLENNILFPRYY